MRDGDISSTDRPVVLVHSSDIHIDDDIRPGRYHGLDGLRYVLKAAHDVGADVLLLAGDTFDHGRVPEHIAGQAGEILAQAQLRVVMLPGNHDPALPEGIFHRSGILGLPRTMVIGHSHPEHLFFEDLGLEILGRPHTSYGDMRPLPPIPARRGRWQVVIGHGHYVPADEWHEHKHRSWLISDADLDATPVDYIALGHWDRNEAVGAGTMRAHYSGAPDLVQTVNVVRLCPREGVAVDRHPLGMPFPRRW